MGLHRVTAWGEQTSLADRKRRAGQALLPGLGRHPVSHLKPLLRELRPGGFLLRPADAESPEHLAELNRELRSLLPSHIPPLLVAHDEGGAGSLVGKPATVWPPMRWLGNMAAPSFCRQVGRALALEARALHLVGVLGPVADIPAWQRGSWIGGRSLGQDPQAVAAQVAALVEGLQDGGVFACPSHFPGLGAIPEGQEPFHDSVQKDRPELEAVDLAPFRAGIGAGAAAIRLAHTFYPAFDELRPATTSPAILHLLRATYAFQGVIVADDVAALPDADLQQYLPAAALASVDLHIHLGSPERQLQAFEILVRAQEEHPTLDREQERTEKRIMALRSRFLQLPTPPMDVVGQLGHTLLAQRIRVDGAD